MTAVPIDPWGLNRPDTDIDGYPLDLWDDDTPNKETPCLTESRLRQRRLPLRRTLRPLD